MANRAYLYAVDAAPTDDWRHPQDEYFDSRWSIPVAWWFFFSPDDLRFVDVHYGDSKWTGLRFIADRLTALKRFESNRELLTKVVDEHLDGRHIDFLLAVLAEWQGSYLVMDADEVLSDAADDALRLRTFLRELQNGQITSGTSFNWETCYSSIEPGDLAQVLIVGYTYGPIGHRLWKKFMEAD